MEEPPIIDEEASDREDAENSPGRDDDGEEEAVVDEGKEGRMQEQEDGPDGSMSDSEAENDDVMVIEGKEATGKEAEGAAPAASKKRKRNERVGGRGLTVKVPAKDGKKEGPQTPGSGRSVGSLDLRDEEHTVLNEDECSICGEQGVLVCCDGPCLRSFHLDCLGVDESQLPEGKWFCSEECGRGEILPLATLIKGPEDEAGVEPDVAARMRHRRLRMTVHREVTMRGQTMETEAKAGELETTAALRGIDYIYRISLDDKNLASFGSDILAVLYDLSSCTEGLVRQAALQRTELLAKRWKARFKTLADIAKGMRQAQQEEEKDTKKKKGGKKRAGDKDKKEEEELEPTTDDINTSIRGVYVLMRMGQWTPLANETRQFVKSCNIRVQEFLKFDPRKKFDPLPDERPHFAVASAIDTAFHADRVGVKLGASVLDVISLLPGLRPYQTCVDVGWEDWEDQADMVINLIHVCSNNGELRLEPALFPEEAAFLRDPDTLKWPMEEEDVHLVGEICFCLKVLGATDDDPLVSKCKTFILDRQSEDGSWPVRDGTSEPWDKFLTTVSGVAGLVPLCARAYGPGDTALADTLRKVNTATTPVAQQAFAKAVKEPAKPKSAPPSVIMCGNTRPLPVRRFQTLQSVYERSSDARISTAKNGGFLIGGVPLELMRDSSLKARSKQRFQELLLFKKRKMPAASGSSSGRPVLGTHWFRNQDKNRLATAVKKAAAAMEKGKFGKALKDFQHGKEPELRPLCGSSRVELFPLYQAVASRGGRAMVPSVEEWAAIAKKVNSAQGMLDRGRRTRDLYDRCLGDFELYWAEEYDSQLKREEVGRIVEARMEDRAHKLRLARQAALMKTSGGEEENEDESEDDGMEGAGQPQQPPPEQGAKPSPAPAAVRAGEGEEERVAGGGGEEEEEGDDDLIDLTLDEEGEGQQEGEAMVEEEGGEDGPWEAGGGAGEGGSEAAMEVDE